MVARRHPSRHSQRSFRAGNVSGRTYHLSGRRVLRDQRSHGLAYKLRTAACSDGQLLREIQSSKEFLQDIKTKAPYLSAFRRCLDWALAQPGEQERDSQRSQEAVERWLSSAAVKCGELNDKRMDQILEHVRHIWSGRAIVCDRLRLIWTSRGMMYSHRIPARIGAVYRTSVG